MEQDKKIVPKNPIQPQIMVDGVRRFKANSIVKYLLDSHPSCDLNHLAILPFSIDDQQQFAQLIGYSVSGYNTLSYVYDAGDDSREVENE